MPEFELPAAAPAHDTPVAEAPVPEVEAPPAEVAAPADPIVEPAVDPVRSAAGRLGAQRVQRLVQLGQQYEQDHGLTPARQRRRQLIQLGKRYEREHGQSAARPRRKRRGDAWADFLRALSAVVKPAYRPAVEQLVLALSQQREPERPREAA